MRCIVHISALTLTSKMVGIRSEYIVRIFENSHFLTISYEQIWADIGVGLANFSSPSLDLGSFPAKGDILGIHKSDVRGWIIFIE